MKHMAPNQFIPGPRGLVSIPRADAGDPNQMLADIQRAVSAMRESHTEELKKLDVVSTERTDRINAEISQLSKALEGINLMVAAMKVGGDGTPAADPDKRAHASAFNQFFRRGVESGLKDLEVKAKLSTQDDPNGGYLVPEETSGTIDRVLGTVSVMRSLATVMPIGTNVYKKLVNMGGTGSGWVGEEAARPETATPTLRELVFTIMEMYANPAITQTSLDDSFLDIAAWLANEVSITFAEQEGAAFIVGSGANRPKGLMMYPTIANASYAWGSVGFVATGAAADFATSNPADVFHDAYGALKQGYRQNASWLMADATNTKVRKQKDGQGNYLWDAPVRAGEVPTILGKPVYTDDNMPLVGSGTFPVAFGDYKRAYLVLDRVGIRVLRDPYTNKPNVHFYTTKRVGGGLQNFEAVKFVKCST